MLKPIPEFPDYYASKDGQIWSRKIWGCHCVNSIKPSIPRKMKAKIVEKTGRHIVCLRKNNRYFYVPVAKLVLMAFKPKRNPGDYACHGIKGISNDSLDNLYWATPSQNALDKHRDGTMICGEKHRCAKLNSLQVRVIRKSYAPRGQFGLSALDLSRIFNVTKHAIETIIKRESWAHVI